MSPDFESYLTGTYALVGAVLDTAVPASVVCCFQNSNKRIWFPGTFLTYSFQLRTYLRIVKSVGV